MIARANAAVLVCVLPVFVSGCSVADANTLPKVFLALLQDTTAVLKEIKDVPTAKAADAKLKVLADLKPKLDEKAAQKMTEEIMRIALTSAETAEINARAMGMR